MEEISADRRAATPERIRELQRGLYRKAKQEKAYRCYSLSDKVYRADILSDACTLVKANQGAPGVDGVTVEALESEDDGVGKFLRA